MMDFLCVLLTDVFSIEVAWIATWLFPIRRPAVFWCLILITAPLSRILSPLVHPYVSLVLYLVNFAVIPYLCWRGPRPWRMVFAAALVLVELAVEMGAVLIAAMAGYSDMRTLRMDPAAIVPIKMAGNAVMLLYGVGLRNLARRVTDEVPDSHMDRLAPFLVVQMIMPACFIMMFTTVVGLEDRRLVASFVLVMACCSLAGLIVIAMMVRFVAIERERLRARELATALDSCLKGVQSQLKLLEAEARSRHDRRNHMQVVDGLVSQGELAEAERYVAALLDTHDAQDGGERP